MLLSPESESIVTATAAVVAENSVAITELFYPHMFAAHPELMRTFNMANQALGEQPRALAASVVAYALHLIDPNAPDFAPVLRRIAHKHVALGITATQYTIVGHHLMWAIGEVLGDAVTPEVASAWDEVYWLFAAQLIAEEARLYALAGTDPERPWRQYRVVERIVETANVVSLLLTPVSGEIPPHRTGQYVSVAVDLPGGGRQPRQYTISSGPRSDCLQITVKRVLGADGAPDGVVSNWLHDHAHPGTLLDVSQPAGDVVLDECDNPLVLISAGIGITPVAAIIEDLSRHQPERSVLLLHADTSHDDHALYRSVSRQLEAMPNARAEHWYRTGAETALTANPAHSGQMDLAGVELPADCTVFMCGSLGFMAGVRRALVRRGVPIEHIHYEVFGPDMWAQNLAAVDDVPEGSRPDDLTVKDATRSAPAD